MNIITKWQIITRLTRCWYKCITYYLRATHSPVNRRSVARRAAERYWLVARRAAADPANHVRSLSAGGARPRRTWRARSNEYYYFPSQSARDAVHFRRSAYPISLPARIIFSCNSIPMNVVHVDSVRASYAAVALWREGEWLDRWRLDSLRQ